MVPTLIRFLGRLNKVKYVTHLPQSPVQKRIMIIIILLIGNMIIGQT